MPFETRELMVQLLAQYETDMENCGERTCLIGTIGPESGDDCCGRWTNLPCVDGSYDALTTCGTASLHTCHTGGMFELLGALALTEIKQQLDDDDATARLARAAIERFSWGEAQQ
jgi:hypothetical protein